MPHIGARTGASDGDQVDPKAAKLLRLRGIRGIVIGPVIGAGLWAMLGAAESLSYAASTGDITPQQAKDELFETIKAMVARNA